MGKSLLIKGGTLFKLSTEAGNVFYVTAEKKEHVELMLFKRGGEEALKVYTIEPVENGYCEMIIGEVDNYKKIAVFQKFLEMLTDA